jgi:hypothetical protein
MAFAVQWHQVETPALLQGALSRLKDFHECAEFDASLVGSLPRFHGLP